jgi:AraC-like DNA-binding protein
MVFPRSSVSITQRGHEPIIATPNVIVFYNEGQTYQRGKVSERGDDCAWFGFSPALLEEAIRPFDPRVSDRPMRPFSFTHGPSSSGSFLSQRLALQHLQIMDSPDDLFIQETMFQVLDDGLADQYGWSRSRNPVDNPSRRDLARAVLEHLVLHFDQRIQLDDLAERFSFSRYHISRVFRQQIGTTIQRSLDGLRLRHALDALLSGQADLAELAFALGYSSHSHFTLAFRRTFGMAPRELRQARVSSAQIKELSSKLHRFFKKRASA